MKRNRKFQPLSDAVKAMRKGNRESEFELLGQGFHSKHTIHKSEKTIQGNRNIKWLTFKILSISDIILFRISYFVQFNGGCVASPETVKDDMYVVRVYADIDITGWIVNDNLSNLQFIWTVNDTPTEIDINQLNNGIVTAVHEISTASSKQRNCYSCTRNLNYLI